MLDSDPLFWAMHALKVDATSAAVSERFEHAGIDVMLMKGPVIGALLYKGEVRSYGDTDLLVSPSDWERAVALLNELGFHDFLGPLEHPRMESEAGTGFLRGSENVDLHSTLSGFDAPAATVWEVLRRDARPMAIGGRNLSVPSEAAVLAHVALHAIHHVDGKPVEDLRRAVDQCSLDEWRAAAALAGELDGLVAFASGLRLAEGGERIVEQLGLDDERSRYFELRAARVPLAEGLNDLLEPGLGIGGRLRLAVSEIFPNAEFMRWNHAIARRGRRGLVASYPVRWSWIARRLPRATTALLAARRTQR